MARDFLYCEETDTKIYSGDIVIISSFPDVKFIAKHGWYKVNTAQKNGWYFINISDKSIVPMELVDILTISKDTQQATSEYRPTLQDMDTPNPVNNYLVIPGTNIRLYDGDIIKISNKPRLKWIVHLGWFIYQEVQNFGWYFESIKNGEILPASIIDLTLCTLVTSKTQGSETYDGKVVNYTRPFTVADAVTLNRTFITLETIEQRDNLDKEKLVNGRLVRVNDVGGVPVYYSWNAETESWEKVDFGGGGEGGIPEVVGTTAHPIILSQLGPGLYRVKGTYKISPTYEMITMTAIDHIAFVSDDDDTQIKVITDSYLTDYEVTDGDVTFVNNYATYRYLEDNYATKIYVDNKIAVIEAEISELITTFRDKVLEILQDVLGSISETYTNNLFN